MNPVDSSDGKPNPFYQPAFGQVVRRQFIGLMAATFGWTLLPSASAQEKKGKGGGKGGKVRLPSKSSRLRCLAQKLLRFPGLFQGGA